MKKVFKLGEIDCAVCAGKLEGMIQKIDGVNNASLNFMSLRLVVELEDSKEAQVLADINKAVKKFDRDLDIKEI